MTKILGIAEGSHDAAWCLIEDGEIIHAHHAERSTKVKNQKWITHIPWWCRDAVFVGHEVKSRREERRKAAGQEPSIENIKVDHEYNHYETHAWAGWATSKFDDCDILCIDAIGEKESAAVFEVRNGKMTEVYRMCYPDSAGLAYSAVTAGLGYKSMEEEYIVMGLAAYGEPIYDFDHLIYENCHKGIKLPEGKPEDIAASIQASYEKWLLQLIGIWCKHDNLILMGGCALNCVANSKIKGKNIWIMPNPGDAGSALGAAARHYGKKLNWKGPYLGTNIWNENVNPREVASHISTYGVAGLANGRAEYGPRALGNRSLLADPRLDIKDTVNDIKRRQRFRPFAPAILEEYSTKFFSGPMNEYMQFVAKAEHDYKSVTHVDGTARVQVVKSDCESKLRLVLEEFYNLTGCPMLLNTSLNIKGQPMVDNKKDAEDWEKRYNVKVF
jgi:carbamoyltransferase